jgi:threonyl-tRNA synthetase
MKDEEITLYKQGNFTDLCRGTHIPDTKLIKAINMLYIAGAYWRGDSNNKMLTQIYGITFPEQSMLDEFLKMREEAEKRDHRKLGKELDYIYDFSCNWSRITCLASNAHLSAKIREFPKR